MGAGSPRVAREHGPDQLSLAQNVGKAGTVLQWTKSADACGNIANIGQRGRLPQGL